MALAQRRWAIVWCLFLSTVINYVNRQTLSVLAPVISKEFALNHTQLSEIFGAFQISYAGTWLLGGVFLDLVGTRIGLSMAVVWWSLRQHRYRLRNIRHPCWVLCVFCWALAKG